MKVKTIIAQMDEIPDPVSRLICGVLGRAVWQVRHPEKNPQMSLDALTFLILDGREWAECAGLKVNDDSKWEALVANL